MSSEQMGISGLADRYAAALFDLAAEGGDLERVAIDLRDLRAMVIASHELRLFLSNPVISRGEQSLVVLALADKAGFCDLSKRFLGLVASNRRLKALMGIIGAYLGRIAKAKGEVGVEVTSAQALTPEQVSALEASLKIIVGGSVQMTSAVDPKLLGGLVVKVGSRMFDASLKTKLQQLQLVMKGVG